MDQLLLHVDGEVGLLGGGQLQVVAVKVLDVGGLGVPGIVTTTHLYTTFHAPPIFRTKETSLVVTNPQYSFA